MVVPKLSECDWANGIVSCQAILEHVPTDAVVLSRGEAHFQLPVFNNKQNVRYWTDNNPRQLQE